MASTMVISSSNVIATVTAAEEELNGYDAAVENDSGRIVDNKNLLQVPGEGDDNNNSDEDGEDGEENFEDE